MRILVMTDPQASPLITPRTEIPLAFAHSAFSGSIGVGREDITPPLGIYARNWGAAEHEVAEGIHRPLTLTALTFQQITLQKFTLQKQSAPQQQSEQKPSVNELEEESQPLVLIAADLGWWRTSADEWFVRSAVLEAFGLDPARLMFSLTHTHAGPAICREDADKPGGDLIAPYLEHLQSAAIRAVRTALKNSRSAVLTWEYGKCALAQNRDLPDPNSKRVLCGYNPAVTADDTLLIGRVTSFANGRAKEASKAHNGERANSRTDEKNGGEMLATLVNYACHPVTLAYENRLISPDFVGAMRELVEANTGGAPCLFLQGASGELAPREQYHADTALTHAQGRSLGYAALGVLAGMLPPAIGLEYLGVVESGAPLGIWKRVPAVVSTTLEARQISVELPLKLLPTVAEIDALLADCADRAQTERLRRKRRIRQTVGDGETTQVPLWIWRIGDSILCGHPNEAYSLLQTELRRRFPERAVGVMNVVNGHTGYLPTADLYDLDLYPVWQTPFDSGCLEHTIARAENEIMALIRDTN